MSEEHPLASPADAAQPASKVAICQRIMDLVDQYHDKPDRHTRGAIRAALMDEWVVRPGASIEEAKAINMAGEHTAANATYDKRFPRVSERNENDRSMYRLGWWDHAWKTAQAGAISGMAP
ncbi:MAG: hypothetical protein WA159_12995 [Variovorax sp.]